MQMYKNEVLSPGHSAHALTLTSKLQSDCVFLKKNALGREKNVNTIYEGSKEA